MAQTQIPILQNVILTPAIVETVKKLAFVVPKAKQKSTQFEKLRQIVVSDKWVWATDAYRLVAQRIDDSADRRGAFPIPFDALTHLPDGRQVAMRSDDYGDVISVSFSDGDQLYQFNAHIPPNAQALLDHSPSKYALTVDRDETIKVLRKLKSDIAIFGNTFITDGEGTTIGYVRQPLVAANAKFLLDGLKMVAGRYVNVQYGDEYEQITFSEDGFVYMVMPYKIDSKEPVISKDRLLFTGREFQGEIEQIAGE